MSGFREWAVIQRYYNDDEGILFQLLHDLTYKTMDGAVYVVPQGFISDLGSIPRFLWGVMPSQEFPSAFVTHDWLCKQSWISRKDANKILYEALKLSHCPEWKARLIYWACWLYAKLWRIK